MDFSLPLTSTLSFTGANGEVQCSTISIIDDSVVEQNESFSVHLLSSSADSAFVNLAQDSATVTITDDDTVLIGWDNTSYTSGEPGSASVCAWIIQGEIARDVFVNYSTADGTAQGNAKTYHDKHKLTIDSETGGDDFVAVINMPLVFSPSGADSPQCGVVLIEDDSVLESTENFLVILTVDDRAVSLSSTVATISILDNDRKPHNVNIMA